jgi:hypothetical protein
MGSDMANAPSAKSRDSVDQDQLLIFGSPLSPN